MSICPTALDSGSLPVYDGWEVGQRVTFVGDYRFPTTPTVLTRDEVFGTESRSRVLLALREDGDPNIPSWTQGSKISEESSAVPYVDRSPLRALFDLVSLPLTRRLVSLYRSGLPWSARKAFFLSGEVGTADSLAYSSGDGYTDSRFPSIRLAASLWDLMTAFDPVFLPIEGGGGYVLRNLDPVSPTDQGCPDEPLATIPDDVSSFSDSAYMPPAYARRPVPGSLDLSGGVLGCPATGTLLDALRSFT